MAGCWFGVYNVGMDEEKRLGEDCIFCQIARGETPAEVVWEDEETIFFHDISPKATVHVVGIPKKHLVSLADMDGDDQAMLGLLMLNITKVADKTGIAESGYRVMTNVGNDAGQEVKHLHWHVLGGEKLGRMVCR